MGTVDVVPAVTEVKGGGLQVVVVVVYGGKTIVHGKLHEIVRGPCQNVDMI